MKKNAGFTLIELVAVMVILAILAVVAIPQFVDLRKEAREAAVEGVAGALSSASALNYALEMANSASGTAISNCNEAGNLLQGGLPAGFTQANLQNQAVAAGATQTCQITHPEDNNVTAQYTVIGVN